MAMFIVTADTQNAISSAIVRFVRAQRAATWILRREARFLSGLRSEILAGLASRGPLSAPGLAVRNARHEVQAALEWFFASLRFGDERFVSADFEMLGAPWQDWLAQSFDSLEQVVQARSRVLFSTDRRAAVPSNFLELQFGRSLRGLETLVRTAVAALVNVPEAGLAARGGFEWVQVSVLDARTSELCRRYAGRRWSPDYQPVGHSLPFQAGSPRHWGCRSLLLALPEGGSAGLRDYGFDDWLASLGDAEANRLLGEREMRLYRRHLLSLGDLVRQSNRPLRLANISRMP